MTGFQYLIVWCAGGYGVLLLLAFAWRIFDDYSDAPFFLVFIGGFVSVIVFLLFWVGYFNDRQMCEESAAAMKVESRYDAHTGCLIKDGDREIPLDKWIRNEESSR